MALGGGIGTLMRFGLSEWVATMQLGAPLAVLVINISGCFLIAFLNLLSDPSGHVYLGPGSRAFLMVGFCGGYTTFSSFSLLSFEAMRHGHLFDLWLNVLLSHGLCGLGIWLGHVIAAAFPRLWFKFNRLLRI